jgi:hypothetical protein
MSHTELRSIDELKLTDTLVLSEDVRLFRVVSIDGGVAHLQGRRRVHLRSIDGARRITLVRAGREQVRLLVDE